MYTGPSYPGEPGSWEQLMDENMVSRKLNRSKKVFACIAGMLIAFCTSNIFAETNKAKHAKVIGTRFPAIKTETLAGTPLSLPDDAGGSITLITIAFKHGTQPQLDSWLEPFLMEFGSKPGFTFYELPMLASHLQPFAFRIDSGMRSGIEEPKHKNVATYYGDYQPYCKALGIQDETIGYAFLLDAGGIIRWKGMGFASPDTVKEMMDQARKLSSSL